MLTDRSAAFQKPCSFRPPALIVEAGISLSCILGRANHTDSLTLTNHHVRLLLWWLS